MKKIITLVIIAAAVLTALTVHIKNYTAEKKGTFTLNSEKIFFSMGTVVHIIYESRDESKIEDIIKEMNKTADIIKQDEKKLSSLKIGIPVILSSDFVNLYKDAKNIYELSNGLYDPTSITVAALYGFPDKEHTLPDEISLKNAKNHAGFENIIYDNKYFMKNKNTSIDFSASSKGYIVDKIVKYMQKSGMKNFIVNAGGDMYVDGLKYGKSTYNVYIEKPGSEKEYLSIIKLQNNAVATSGNYERYFIDNTSGRRITHIFQGITFEPSNNYQSVSVIAKNAEQADTFATLYFLSTIDEIKNYCTKFATPVLIYTLDNKTIKLCSWQEHEYLK